MESRKHGSNIPRNDAFYSGENEKSRLAEPPAAVTRQQNLPRFFKKYRKSFFTFFLFFS